MDIREYRCVDFLLFFLYIYSISKRGLGEGGNGEGKEERKLMKCVVEGRGGTVGDG